MSHSISESEWKVIEVLWKKPNSNVSDIVNSLESTGWSYSTVKTMLHRLVNKGFVKVDRTVGNCFILILFSKHRNYPIPSCN